MLRRMLNSAERAEQEQGKLSIFLAKYKTGQNYKEGEDKGLG